MLKVLKMLGHDYSLAAMTQQGEGGKVAAKAT